MQRFLQKSKWGRFSTWEKSRLQADCRRAPLFRSPINLVSRLLQEALKCELQAHQPYQNHTESLLDYVQTLLSHDCASRQPLFRLPRNSAPRADGDLSALNSWCQGQDGGSAIRSDSPPGRSFWRLTLIPAKRYLSPSSGEGTSGIGIWSAPQRRRERRERTETHCGLCASAVKRGLLK